MSIWFRVLLIFSITHSTLLLGNDPLPSWNEGPAKKAIIEFVQKTTIASSVDFLLPEERIATFDQDGTLWVEHPIYTQVLYCLDRVPALVSERPKLRDEEPFKSILTGDQKKIATLSEKELEKVAMETLTGMTIEQFQKEVKSWIKGAKDKRWQHLYTELTYKPMQEVIQFFQANGYKTYIVTGGGQEFVRVYSHEVYRIPIEQVVGTMGGIKYSYDINGKPILTKVPTLLLNDNNAGKPEGIQMMIGRRPAAAFGNSTGDKEMLEYTKAGKGLRLAMLVLHDDGEREYAYGPALGLPDTTVGTFSEALYQEAIKDGWIVISMKKDWKQIFSY